jgi:hypothetical protein
MLEKISSGKFQPKKEAHPNLEIVPPTKYNYTGKVWFLIDGLSFSTTAEFCALSLQYKKRVLQHRNHTPL